MSRNVWIAVICAAVAFVLYTAWQRSQLSPRIPITSDEGGASMGGGGLLDSISRTVDKLNGIFQGIGGRQTVAAQPAQLEHGTSGVSWA
jgi:hypothetical protein